MSSSGSSSSSRRSRRSSGSSRHSSKTDSSPESLAASNEPEFNCYHNFRIVGDKVRCTGPKGESITLSRLGKIKWFEELDPDYPDPQEILMTSANDLHDAIWEWTEFFLNTKRVKLTGKYKCANKLSSREENDVIKIEADVTFPYWSFERRVVNGEVQARSSTLRSPMIHLDSNHSQLVLNETTLYVIGGDHEAESPPQSRFCRVCSECHQLLDTPCRRAQTFLPTECNRTLRKKLTVSCSGPRVICVRPDGETLFNTSMNEKGICSGCEQKAVNNNKVWHELDGNCKVDYCINEDVFCMHEIEGCKHYMFVNQGVEHNLSSYEIPRAVAEGRLQPVMAASAESYTVERDARFLRKMALETMKKKEKISLGGLVKKYGGSVQELLALAMYDTLWADCIDRNKLITLNKINGCVENPNTAAVGPWLDGRLVQGPDGRMWHVPKGEVITIKTQDSISYVSKWRESDGKSDLLGRFVA